MLVFCYSGGVSGFIIILSSCEYSISHFRSSYINVKKSNVMYSANKQCIRNDIVVGIFIKNPKFSLGISSEQMN